MSRLADPTICPDCRADLRPDGSCPGCGLRLSGPLAVDLWHTMLRADGLVEQLRTATATAAATPGAVTAPHETPAPSAVPSAVPPAGPPATPAARRLPSASVPVVLLGLGGLCLLVAAVVFVAVTWSSLGIGARTAILLGVTALVATAAALVTRRGLRIASETLWVVACGMLALDWFGAHSAGLLGLDRLDARHVTGVVGVLVASAGVAATAWSARRGVQLLAPQAVAVLGLLVTVVAEAWTAPHDAAADTVAVAALTLLAWALRRTAPWAAAGAGLWAALSWLLLVGSGADRLSMSAGDQRWWSGLEGWPLLAAAALAVGLVLVLGLPPVRSALGPLAGRAGARAESVLDGVRSVAAGAALVCLALLAVGPLDEPTRDLVIGSCVVGALGLLAALTPPVWARAAAVLAGTGAVALGAVLALRPWQLLSGVVPTDGHASLLVSLPPLLGGPAPWTTIPAGAAALVAAWGATRALPAALRTGVAACVAAAGPAVAGLAVADVVLVAGAPLWAAAVALAVALVAAVAAVAWQQGEPATELTALVAALAVLAPALRLSLASHLLAALLATALALALLAGHRLLRPAFLWEVGPALLAVLAVPFSAFGVAAGMLLAGASADALAFAVAGAAVATGLGARFLARDRVGRDGMELVSLPVGLAAVALAPTAATAGLVATVVGSAVCLLAVVDSLVWVGWLGSAVLALATLLRVSADVTAPEVVSLPAAALLLAAGTWRMRRDPHVSSVTALGSGLVLALVPSLLLALDEPVSLRGALVGTAALAALAAGVACRWSAPFLVGAVTTGVLAVRHLWPVAEALPRWVAFGSVGLVLLLVGTTWESRRRDLAAAARYLRALR
ncbi:MAG TPA: hypothetical protein VFM09_05260 [Marmoricola sp.]|nr:hypothetical protein [Marmoricola sp.]